MECGKRRARMARRFPYVIGAFRAMHASGWCADDLGLLAGCCRFASFREACRAVHGVAVSGYERDGRGPIAPGANDIGLRPVGEPQLGLASGAALRTACRNIDQRLFPEKLLLSSGPRKRLAALSTRQCLIRKVHVGSLRREGTALQPGAERVADRPFRSPDPLRSTERMDNFWPSPRYHDCAYIATHISRTMRNCPVSWFRIPSNRTCCGHI
ncbi:MAG: hypothetical protein AVDCRST_MAG87-1394 [uncultured Thermomicrobiales bacterium]|uniref:Uncharacterized protein n=1 Tax=uncultured Thermomicrobiales bacterium TaxID=1645740 RepID=A0A6J4UTF7_9BACT|nr:MAG: hypothetical protein AVDCRST_MAG87-1394 [uncultured Thermomicrobiales bacterium]